MGIKSYEEIEAHLLNILLKNVIIKDNTGAIVDNKEFLKAVYEAVKNEALKELRGL